MKVSEGHVSHVFMIEYFVPGYIPVNAHIVKSGTYDQALKDFASVDGEAGGSKRIANTCEIVEVICCGGTISLHPDLQNATGEKLHFFF
jgi:hypothetical protein